MIVIAELKKPYTDKARADFIVENNYNQGLMIEEDNISIRALDYTEEEKEAQKELEEQQKAYDGNQEAINALKDDLLTATLMGDEDWIADLKAEYAKLTEGE